MTDPERYLRKARESLASAKADVAVGRYNSAANRAYYAAFQAAVAALIHNSIQPAKAWQHKFVTSQLSGKLIKRRKLLPSVLTAMLDDLFRFRALGDYEPEDVSKTDASRGAKNAARFIQEVDRAVKLSTIREASAEYAASVAAAPSLELAERRIDELEALIRTKYPEAQFGVIQLGSSDYRLNVYIKQRSSYSAFSRLLGSRTTDILVDDDIWIVVIPHPLSELRNN